MLPILSLTGLILGVPQIAGLTPEQAVRASLADCDAQNNQDQPFLRYLWLPVEDADSLKDFETALRIHVNLISREAEFHYPAKVAPGLWRVDIREYQWSERQFQALARIDPYFHHRDEVVEVVEIEEEYDQEYGFHTPQGWHKTHTQRQKRVVKRKESRVVSRLFAPLAAAQMAGLALLTQSQQPISRADWFLVQGARQLSLTNRQTGAGYYDWLGGLASTKDYFRLIGFDPKAANRVESTIRAVVGESKVTQQNREIVRQGATTGPLWTTFEAIDQSGAGVAINHLRAGEFRTDASEFYGVLPNGLPATFLANADGDAQTAVPDTIAQNDAPLRAGRDFRVHVNLACLQCHAGQVLQPIGDDVRAVYQGKLVLFTDRKAVDLELRRQYLVSLDRPLERDRQAYQDAFRLVSGVSAQAAAVLYSGEFNRYAYGRVDLKIAARWLGVRPEQLEKALKDGAVRRGFSDFRFDPWLAGRTVPVLNVEDGFADLTDLLFGVLKVEVPR